MRFEREPKTLASQNHSNIAQIYGIEGHALVMELVEGEDLSALIARGRAEGESVSSSLRDSASAVRRGLDDALSIARQIADALEAAHGRASSTAI